MAAFNSQDYVSRFGPSLAAAAQGSMPGVSDGGAQDDSGSADPSGALGSDYDPDQEGAVARTQSTGNVAPLPSQRQMFYGSPTPPRGARGGALSAGPTPSLSDQSPDQQGLNAAHAASMEQLTDDDLKEYQKHIDTQAAATGYTHKETGDKVDFDAIYKHTFEKSLQDHAALADMTEAQARKFQNPTWRDKIGMFLDATNRAGIIHAQNPDMSRGDIWALATRNALQGWAANAQGAHDAYVKQAGALQSQAEQDAKDAVKRQMDQAGYGQKIAAARKANSDADKLDIDNKSEARYREAEIAEKYAQAADKRTAAGKSAKGDLVTVKNSDGTESTGYIEPKTGVFTPAKDASGKPVGGQVQKTATDKTQAPVDDKLLTQAREAYRDEVKAIRANIKNRKLSDQQVAQMAVDNLKVVSPILHQALTQQAQTAAKPGAPAAAAATPPAKPAWVTPAQ